MVLVVQSPLSDWYGLPDIGIERQRVPTRLKRRGFQDGGGEFNFKHLV
jgi:hypothetical protein